MTTVDKNSVRGHEGPLATEWSRREFLRKSALSTMSLVAISSVLAACTQEEGATTTALSTLGGTEGTAASAVGQLSVALSSAPPSFDEEFAAGGAFRSAVVLQAGLFEYADHVESSIGPGALDLNWGSSDITELVRPLMVESFDVSNDQTTYTFALKRGWLSHAGNELTANDVKWRFDRLFGLESIGSFFAGISGLSGPDSVRVVDDYTVEFQLDEPSPNFLMSLANHIRMTVPDSTVALENVTDDDPWATEWFQGNYVGFGPYKIESFDPSVEMVVVAHDGHPSPPPTEKLVFRFVPESSGRLALVSRGEVDVAIGFTPTELATMADTEGIRIWDFPGNARLAVPMNPKYPPFDNPTVRQALSYAVPYENIVAEVMSGYGVPARGPLCRKDAGYDAQQFPYTYDLQRARDLLDEAGFADGFETSFAYDAGDPLGELVGIILQTAFSEIGVTLELNALTAAAYSEALSTGGSPLIYWQLGADQPDNAYVASVWFDPDAVTNWTGYDNRDVATMIKERITIPDWDERVIAFEEVIQTIIDDAPWLFLAETGFQVVTREGLEGIRWDQGHIDLNEATLSS